jgi:hypothetical protein
VIWLAGDPRAWQLRKQPVPGAVQSALKAHRCCDKHVQFSRLDFLNRADVQIRQLREPLLREIASVALAAHVCAENAEFVLDRGIRRHAPLSRIIALDWNGAIGRKMITASEARRNFMIKKMLEEAQTAGATPAQQKRAIITTLAAAIGLFLLFISSAKASDSETFWLIQRVSITTSAGVTGIPPGTKVTLIKDNGMNLTVTDGTSTFEIPRAQLTTDIEVARKAASLDYSAQVAIANATEKELAAAQKSQADDEKARTMAEQEKSMAAKAQRIIGHVLYQEGGGLIVECDEPRSGRVVTSSRGSIGGGGGVYTGPEPKQSEVEGTIWLIGHPKQQSIADGDSINVRAYETGIHQSPGGTRVRQYKFVSNGK